jgi:hypothetical protein
VGNNSHLFALSARTAGATQRLEIDNLQVTTIPPGFIVLPNPIISEFMAENDTTLEDEDCRTSDWLEIFNSTANAINLEGWYLTDDPDEPAKWPVPDLPLDANERMIIFASNQDRIEGELHTDFRLDSDGGYLALVKPDGLSPLPTSTRPSSGISPTGPWAWNRPKDPSATPPRAIPMSNPRVTSCWKRSSSRRRARSSPNN